MVSLRLELQHLRRGHDVAFLQDADGRAVVEAGSNVQPAVYGLGFRGREVVGYDAVVVCVGFEAADDVERSHFVAYGPVVARGVGHVVCGFGKVLFECEAAAVAV